MPERTLLVVSLSDSFADAWPPLAAGAGLGLALQPAAADPESANGAAATLVAAGGTEEMATEVVRRLARAGVAPAVAGARAEHRLALALAAAGADDYFALPADLSELGRWVQRRAAAAHPASGQGRDAFSPLVGRSEAMRLLIDRARRVAAAGDATVLLTGETGTGKGLLAEAIHRAGRRAPAPFVEVNCAALPASLLEAELFGHEKGAFTDARAAKPGLVEHAEGGTLFLDEIGELPLALQAKLLTVLERRRLRRLGGLAERAVDVRVMAATHVELAAAVQAQRFRADLYFRLDVVTLRMPALRERGTDVVLLAEHFGRALAGQHGTAHRPLAPADVAALLGHDWRGTVRELRNAVERAIVCGDPLRLHAQAARTSLAAVTEPAPARSRVHEGEATILPAREGGRVVLPFPATLRAVEREAARAMIAHHAGNKSRAAAALGISRKRLYALLAAG